MKGQGSLSARMQAVAGLVTEGSRVCDVGCDHGYVPIYLVCQEFLPGCLPWTSIKGLFKGPGTRGGGRA